VLCEIKVVEFALDLDVIKTGIVSFSFSSPELRGFFKLRLL